MTFEPVRITFYIHTCTCYKLPITLVLRSEFLSLQYKCTKQNVYYGIVNIQKALINITQWIDEGKTSLHLKK